MNQSIWPPRMFLKLLEQRCFHPWRVCYSRCMSSNVVMSFGDGSQGALGLPASLTGIGGDAYEPTKVVGLPSDICSVSAGHYHSLAVTSNGNLWSWGRNREAQLGRGHECIDLCNEPMKVEGLNHHVKATFASGVISAALGDDGSLWVWGTSKRGQLGLGKDVIRVVVPSKVKALDHEKVVKVSLGWGHALAQTESGKLYGWGYAADGRLGRIWETPSTLDSISPQVSSGFNAQDVVEKIVLEGMEKEKHMPIIWEPVLIGDVHGVEVVDIACGLDHSLVLCRNNMLLSNGSNVYGQLGREEHNMEMLPVNTGRFIPESIASGLGHSLAICSVEGGSKNIVSWGWNHNSQLGRTGPNNIPLVIQELEGEMPLSVSGGRVHSIALTSERQLWVWGCGKNGRLGLGSSIDVNEPSLLECFDGYQVLQAVSGFDHNLVLLCEE